MTSIKSVSSITLDLPPSCISFCPTRPQFFVVGTYFLHPAVSVPQDGSDEQRRHQQSGLVTEPASASSAVAEAHADVPAAEEAAAVPANSNAGPQKRTGSLLLFRLNGDSMYVSSRGMGQSSFLATTLSFMALT